MGHPLPIQRPGNTALKWLWICTLKWGVPLAVRERMWIQQRCTASLQCGCPQPSQFCISESLDLKWRPYSISCEVIWPESPSLFSMGISKVTCVWDLSWNGHRISCQNYSCLRDYSKHIRDICEGAAESCTPMSCLYWGWLPSIWRTVLRCKIVRQLCQFTVLYLQATVTNVNKKHSNVIDKFTPISPKLASWTSGSLPQIVQWSIPYVLFNFCKFWITLYMDHSTCSLRLCANFWIVL